MPNAIELTESGRVPAQHPLVHESFEDDGVFVLRTIAGCLGIIII